MVGEYKWRVWVIDNLIQFSLDLVVVTETSLTIFCVSIDHNCLFYFILFLNIHIWMVSCIITTYTTSLMPSPIYKHFMYLWKIS